MRERLLVRNKNDEGPESEQGSKRRDKSSGLGSSLNELPQSEAGASIKLKESINLINKEDLSCKLSLNHRQPNSDEVGRSVQEEPTFEDGQSHQ